MLDRWGNHIRVYWAEYEILWVRAAMTLPCAERQEAYRDIADMTGRTLAQVRGYANSVRNREEVARAKQEEERRAAIPVLPPSIISKPTMAQLMGGRA